MSNIEMAHIYANIRTTYGGKWHFARMYDYVAVFMYYRPTPCWKYVYMSVIEKEIRKLSVLERVVYE